MNNNNEEGCYLCSHADYDHAECERLQQKKQCQDSSLTFYHIFAISLIVFQHAFTILHTIQKMGGVFTVFKNSTPYNNTIRANSSFLMAKATCIVIPDEPIYEPVSCNCVSTPYPNGVPLYTYGYHAYAYIIPQPNQFEYLSARDEVYSLLELETVLSKYLLACALLYSTLTRCIYTDLDRTLVMCVSLNAAMLLFIFYVSRHYFIIMPLENNFCKIYNSIDVDVIEAGTDPLAPLRENIISRMYTTYFDLNPRFSGQFFFVTNGMVINVFVCLINVLITSITICCTNSCGQEYDRNQQCCVLRPWPRYFLTVIRYVADFVCDKLTQSYASVKTACCITNSGINLFAKNGDDLYLLTEPRDGYNSMTEKI